MATETVSKGEFAKLRNVSAGRVSQWIAEGKITEDALEGAGKFARVRVAIATDQLRQRLDVGQRLGNGLETNLDDDLPFDRPTSMTSSSARVGGRDPLDESIRRAKLEQLQRRNRLDEREELADSGVYTPAADARSAMTGMAAAMLSTFEGGLADLATAVSAKFGIPTRDVLHVMRTEFRQIRARAADAARRRAEDLPEVIDHEPAAAPAAVAA